MKKKIKTKRPNRVEIQLSDCELNKIKSINSNIPLARLIRETCLHESETVRKVVRTADPQLIAQIAAIGNLLNQATKIANHQKKSGKPIDTARLLLAIKSVEKSLSEVSHAA